MISLSKILDRPISRSGQKFDTSLLWMTVLMTVFSLGHGTAVLGYSREQFLLMQMAGMLFFALGIPLSARYGDRWGTRRTMIVASVLIIGFGVLFAPLFQPHSPWLVTAFLCLGLFLMGLTYGPLGTYLSELFPTAVRYTGSSMTFNFAGILGASLAPYAATALASTAVAYMSYELVEVPGARLVRQATAKQPATMRKVEEPA